MSDAGTNDGHYVELLESRLRELLNRVVVQITVNEKWYLATYPDVAAAVESGALKSARDHYIAAGFFENRMPLPVEVDEPWYVKEYPDVAEAIKAGAFANGTQHFARNGFQEGRLPSPGWSLLG